MLEAKWTQRKTNKNLGSRSIPYWHAFLSRNKIKKIFLKTMQNPPNWDLKITYENKTS